jgi:hypothetical protein
MTDETEQIVLRLGEGVDAEHWETRLIAHEEAQERGGQLSGDPALVAAPDANGVRLAYYTMVKNAH